MRINLLPEEYRPKPQIQALSFIILLIMTVSVVFGWAFALLAVYNNQVLTAQSEEMSVQLKDLKSQVEEAEQRDKIFAEIKKLQKDAAQISVLYQPTSVALRKMDSVIFDDMWLNDVSVDMAGKVKISGSSIVFPQMGTYLDRLIQQQYFKKPRMIEMRREKEEQLNVYRFTLETDTGRNSLEYAEK
jgi:Tfp pilus assembly protein PilN